MSFIVILLIVIVALFAVAFLTKRRFGVLGLALTAGALVSELWVGDLTPLIERTGVILIQPPLESVVAAGLILAPALLLLISGPTYHHMKQRLFGAFVFALLAAALLLDVFGAALIIEGAGKQVYDTLTQYRPIIVTAAIVLALFDLLATKTPKHVKPPKH